MTSIIFNNNISWWTSDRCNYSINDSRWLL